MNIDINLLRGISTVLMLIAFSCVCFWAFNSKRKDALNDAAQIPFADDPHDIQNINIKEDDKRD